MGVTRPVTVNPNRSAPSSRFATIGQSADTRQEIKKIPGLRQ